jgi:hypothetical protein
MRLRIGRLDGTQIQEFRWRIHGLTQEHLVTHLRETLLRHYDSDDIWMWPNDRYVAETVPQAVTLWNDRGEQILAYDIHDLMRDTGFRLCSQSRDPCDEVERDDWAPFGGAESTGGCERDSAIGVRADASTGSTEV